MKTKKTHFYPNRKAAASIACLMAMILTLIACPNSTENGQMGGENVPNTTETDPVANNEDDSPEEDVDKVWIDVEGSSESLEFLSLDLAFDWIDENITEGGIYTVRLGKNESIGRRTLYYDDKTATIILKSNNKKEKQISWNGVGSRYMLTRIAIGRGVTFILDRGIAIVDSTSSIYDCCIVFSVEGNLIMKQGSTIIKKNENSTWNGIVVRPSGEFIMEGGEIIGNQVCCTGVTVSGRFTMNQGSIFNCSSDGIWAFGGGVFVDSEASFTMNGGLIAGNVSDEGGGVYVGIRAQFTMNGGEISQNWGPLGGGVRVRSGQCTINGGKICDNTGDGVYIAWDTNCRLIMTGGEISGNSGNGIYISFSNMAKTGGEIFNNAKYAIYAGSSSSLAYMEKTAEPEKQLTFSYSREVNGEMPFVTGPWDYVNE